MSVRNQTALRQTKSKNEADSQNKRTMRNSLRCSLHPREYKQSMKRNPRVVLSQDSPHTTLNRVTVTVRSSNRKRIPTQRDRTQSLEFPCHANAKPATALLGDASAPCTSRGARDAKPSHAASCSRSGAHKEGSVATRAEWILLGHGEGDFEPQGVQQPKRSKWKVLWKLQRRPIGQDGGLMRAAA